MYQSTRDTAAAGSSALMRIIVCDEFQKRERAGLATRTSAGLSQAISDIFAKVGGAGNEGPSSRPCSPATLRRWLATYEKASAFPSSARSEQPFSLLVDFHRITIDGLLRSQKGWSWCSPRARSSTSVQAPWLCTCICNVSRRRLGVTVCALPSPAAAITAVRQAMSSSLVSDTHENRFEADQGVRPDHIRTDAAQPFLDERFQRVLDDYGIPHHLGSWPSSASTRASMEIFMSTATRRTECFLGLALKEFELGRPSRADILLQAALRDAARIFNARPHGALHGRTPDDVWLEHVQRVGVQVCDLRDFGADDSRPITIGPIAGGCQSKLNPL